MSSAVLGLIAGALLVMVALSVALTISVYRRLKDMGERISHLAHEIEELEELEKSKLEKA